MRRISVLVAAAITAAACTSPGGTSRDPNYFEGLRPVAIEVTRAIAEVGSVFDGEYESLAMRTTRLTDLRTGADLAIAADRADRLTPGSLYRDDHEQYLAMIDAVRDLHRSFDAAVAGGDTAAAAAAAAAMEATAGLTFASLGPEFCAEVTFDMRLCDPPSEDGYPAAFHRTFSELAAGYTPLLRPAPLALSSNEAERYLALIDPQAATLLTTIAAALMDLTPPDGRQADHVATLALLSDAADAHDTAADHETIRLLLCDHGRRLSEDAAATAAVFFDDDDMLCRG